jgi:predicted MFS family arabinose efflux permease
MTVSYIDRSTLGVLAPALTKELEISEAAYGWIASAFSIAYLFGTPVAGWWIDRVGARRGLVASVLAWSTIAALHAVVPGFAVLFALRIALGIAESPSFPGAAQTVQRILPPVDHPRGFGVLFTGSSIGFVIVPPLADWLAREIGWRSAFLVTAMIGLSWLPLWLALTSRRAARTQLDTRPASLGERPPRSLKRKIMFHPIMLRALLGIFAAAPVTGFMYGWGSKYLVRTFELEQGGLGKYLWVPAVCFDAGAIIFGDLSARQQRPPGQPPRLLYLIGLAIATTFALMPLAETPWQGILFMSLGGVGGGALYTLCTADLFVRMPPESVSFAGGVVAGAQSLALIIMNPLVGAVVGHYGHYDGVTIAIGLWTIPGSLAWLLWKPAVKFG